MTPPKPEATRRSHTMSMGASIGAGPSLIRGDPRRRLFLLVVLVVIICLLHRPASVMAQQSRILHADAEPPDFTRPQTVFALLCTVVLPPLYLLMCVLLWKRRKHFPIAGRGSSYLLWLSGFFTFNCLAYCLVGLLFPFGMSCPVQVFLLYFGTIPTCVLYIVRGWTLAFRVEIMSFLDESRWREEKRNLLAAHRRATDDAADEEAEAARYEQGDAIHTAETETEAEAPLPAQSVCKPNRTFIQVQVNQAEPADQLLEEADATPLPGAWFIHHRRWIEPGFLYPFLGAFTLVVLVVLVLVSVFDTDADFATSHFRDTGVLRPTDPDTSFQFHGDTWLTSPTCLVYSVKALSFEFLLALVITPAVLWCGWRLMLDKQRMDARRREQASVHRLVYGVDLPSLSVTKVGRYELDDAQNAKKELFAVVVIASTGSVIYFPIQYFAPEWQFLVFVCIYNGLAIRSLVRPLWLSYAISRQHRKMLGTGLGSKVRSIADRLPHHRPYYTLKFIISNPRAYEVLVACLQKEYSSENALFYTEARSFERAAKMLEARIPNWPSAIDEDEEGTEGTRRRIHSSVGAAAAKRRQIFVGAGGSGALTGGSVVGSPGGRSTLKACHRGAPSTVLAASGSGAVSPLVVNTRRLLHHSSMELTQSPVGQSPAAQSTTTFAFETSPLVQQPPTSSPSMSGPRHPHSRRASNNNESDAAAAAAASSKANTPVMECGTFALSGTSPNGLGSLTHGESDAGGASKVNSPTLDVRAFAFGAASQSFLGGRQISLPIDSSDPGPGSSKVDSPAPEARALTFGTTPNSPTMHPQAGSQVSLPRGALDYAPIDYSSLHLEARRLKAWALQVSDDYLVRASTYEINIAEDLSRLVPGQVHQLRQWNPSPDQDDTSSYPIPPPFPLSTLYKATCLAVFQLIERDSFRRFILTPGFQGLLAKADEEELARVEKQQDLTKDVAAQVDKAMKALSTTPVAIHPSQQTGSRGSGGQMSLLPLTSVSPLHRERASRVRPYDADHELLVSPPSPRGPTVEENHSSHGDSLPGTVTTSANHRSTLDGSPLGPVPIAVTADGSTV